MNADPAPDLPPPTPPPRPQSTPPTQSVPAPPMPMGPRPRGIRLGRILGVPVYLKASWLLLAVILVIGYAQMAQERQPPPTTAGAYALAAGFTVCLLLSVLLHELGHAVTARRFGVKVRAITLELLGGYTEMEADSPSPGADLLISIIGPLISGVLGAVALGIWYVLPPDIAFVHELVFQIALANLIVAVFNALPGLPLDGGRALRALVWAVTGNRHTGSRVAGWIGRAVAVATLTAALLLVQVGRLTTFGLIFAVLVALVLWQGATASIVHGRVASRLPQVDLRRLVRPVYAVPAGTPLAEAQRRAALATEGRVDGSRPGGGRIDRGRATIAVADASGRVVALVHEQAAAAVPAERRPWVPVESVARTLEPGRTLDADLRGEDIIRAMQANPAQSYLVVSSGEVVGVLQTADLARMLGS